jgi:hypothetical protein
LRKSASVRGGAAMISAGAARSRTRRSSASDARWAKRCSSISPVHLTVRTVHSFRWVWRSRPIEAVYEVLGSGAPVLLLPAFSTVSSREEMRPLASGLAATGFACTLIDWPGFGSSTRGRLVRSRSRARRRSPRSPLAS